MLLINPPLVKPCEPPPGIAKLSAALEHHGYRCTVLDANIEGLHNLLHRPLPSGDRWTTRAARHLESNLAQLRDRNGFGNLDRYKRAVMDLNRVVEVSASSPSVHLSLSNYQHKTLSPVRSADLLFMAEQPEGDPFYPYFSRRLTGLLDTECPSVIGFSLNFLSQALPTFAMIGFLRQEFPGCRIILGGGLVTSWLSRPDWRNPFGALVDACVAGPGEAVLLEMLGHWGPAKGHCPPDYASLPLGTYLAPGLTLPYSASSGCYWNRCAFCPERAEGNPYVPVPPQQAIQELRTLTERHHPSLIHLLDNAISPSLLKALCADPLEVPWYGFVRFDEPLADLDFCHALKRSGCVMLKLGLESGDQRVIDLEQKGVDLEVASRVLRTLEKAGIATYIYLLFGTPSETLTEARKTLDYTVRHRTCIDFLNLAIFNLPLTSPDGQGLETDTLYEGDLSLYTGFKHPGGWHRRVVRQFLDKEFRRHPGIAPILRNDPPFFTSNHAPFFSAAWREAASK